MKKNNNVIYIEDLVINLEKKIACIDAQTLCGLLSIFCQNGVAIIPITELAKSVESRLDNSELAINQVREWGLIDEYTDKEGNLHSKFYRDKWEKHPFYLPGLHDQ